MFWGQRLCVEKEQEDEPEDDDNVKDRASVDNEPRRARDSDWECMSLCFFYATFTITWNMCKYQIADVNRDHKPLFAVQRQRREESERAGEQAEHVTGVYKLESVETLLKDLLHLNGKFRLLLRICRQARHWHAFLKQGSGTTNNTVITEARGALL